MAGLASAVALVLVAMLGPVAPVAAQGDDASVDVEIVAGFGGQIGTNATFPITIVLTSARARTVEVQVSQEEDVRTILTELPAGAPVELQLAMTRPAFAVASFRVSAEVIDGERRLGRGDVEVRTRADSTIVGIGPSFAAVDLNDRHPTVGSIQQALLVSLTAPTWDRPGALDAMSGVVLGAADLDALDDEQTAVLASWVWRGGNLALDVARTDRLPVVDLDAGPGERTAVGAGWVRFTDGRAAAGSWSTVLEPATARAVIGAEMMMGGWWGPGGDVGLIDISFLPVSAVALAVFGTALLAGPAMWFALRSRSRRRMMWVASPALSLAVAAGLIVMGQGVFTRAETRANGQMQLTPWNTTGDVSFGLKSSVDLDLSRDAAVLDSLPAARVTDDGGRLRTRVDLPRNGFGSISLAGIQVEGAPAIEVSAVAVGDDVADVTVTNHSDSPLVDVSVRTVGRVRGFADVPAGGSVTMPFLVDSDFEPLAQVFPLSDADMGMGPFTRSTRTDHPVSRGLVYVTGSVDSTVSAAGLEGTGRMHVAMVAPVTPSADAPGRVRIDVLALQSVGGEFGAFDEELANGDFFFEEEVAEDPGVATTLAPQPGGPQGDELQRSTMHVRLTAAEGRTAAPCGIQTMASAVAVWDGATWVPSDKVGDPYRSARIVGTNQVQQWSMPAIPPGGALYVRVDAVLASQPALLFDCGPRP